MRVLVRLAGYAWRHKPRLLLAYLSMAGATVAAIAIPKMLGSAIDEAISSGIRQELLFLGLAIVATSVLRGIFSYMQNYMSESLSQMAAFDLRNDFFRKLQSLSFGYHDQQQTGNLMSKATADVEAVRRFTSMGMIRLLSSLMMVSGVATLMLTTNWRLGLISMVFVPPIVWRAISMGRRLRGTWMTVQAETGHMTTVLQENLSGMRVVKAFGAREFEEAKFEDRASRVADHTYSAAKLFASQGSLMTLIFTAATGVILLVGGGEVASGRLSAGDLATFILLMGLLAMPIRMGGWMVSTFSRAASAGQRIFDVLDAESPVQERPDAVVMSNVLGAVKIPRGLPQLRLVHARGPRHRPGGAARGARGDSRSPRLGQKHDRAAHTEVLRRLRGQYNHRRPGCQRHNPGLPAAQRRHSAPGCLRIRRLPSGQHRLRRLGRLHGRRGPGCPRGPARRLHPGAAQGLRLDGRRARGQAFGRPAPAPGDCPNAPSRPAHSDPRRLDVECRHGHRVRDPAGDWPRS